MTPGVADKVRTPSVAKSDWTRDDHIQHETARDIITALAKYEFASLRQVLFHLLYHTGMRTGAAHTPDINEVHLDGDPYVAIRHRPKTGTPLKRGQEGERNVSLLVEELVDALEAYIIRHRSDVTDEYGREPLLASQYGRIAKSTIQAHVYRSTQPCERTGECPHSEDPDACPYRSADKASQCPSSVSPHAIRRSAITSRLQHDISKEIASKRMNVSVDRLDDHYDARDEESKRQTRRRILRDMNI